jgi:hypothetical protein
LVSQWHQCGSSLKLTALGFAGAYIAGKPSYLDIQNLTAQLDAADCQNRQAEKELATRQNRIDWLLTPGRFSGGMRRRATARPFLRKIPGLRKCGSRQNAFCSCERDFNALSGWGAGSRVPHLRAQFVYCLVARRVVPTSSTALLKKVKSAMICHIRPLNRPHLPSLEWGAGGAVVSQGGGGGGSGSR